MHSYSDELTLTQIMSETSDIIIIVIMNIREMALKFRIYHQCAAIYRYTVRIDWLRGTVGRTSVFDRRTFPVLRSTCS